MDAETSQSENFLFNDLKKGHELRWKLSEITNGLQIYEEISVIFLMCETPRTGLTIMEEILLEPDVVTRKNLFHKWLKHLSVFRREDWKEKLIEVLVTLQNYRLAGILSLETKQQLIMKFKPKNNSSTYHMSAIRKVLYNLCEELDSHESSRLMAMMENNKVYPVKSKYLEYKLLVWSENGVINLGNDKPIDVQVLLNHLKSFNMKNLIHDIEIICERTNCQMLRRKYKSDSELSEHYEINSRQNLGLCVIINQKNFTSKALPKRWGTDRDAERLIEVFTAFGFDIKIHSDLSYHQFMNRLCFYAKTMPETASLFVLIILSHGSENVIFTSDSIPVDMNTIEMIFQGEICESLIGKPKIFIVQSCQGEKWQKLTQDSTPDVETDNSSSVRSQQVACLGPQKGDSMIAWSTVQGFASFRDKYNGSWYIQELCNELWKFGDTFDLVEILTKVNNNLRSKVYGSQFMVPSLLLSLRAKVLFPNVRENFYKGRRLMVERLMFDMIFREFLADCGAFVLKIMSKGS